MYATKTKLHERQKKHLRGQLRTVALDVTFNCNLACNHCYAAPFLNSVKSIDVGILKKALDEFYQLGVFHYVLQGGEPIADMKRLEQVIALCYPDETYINVISNGWAMKPETISRLKECKVDKITFSLDSAIAEEHDQNRRSGSFQRVNEAIDDVRASGLLVGLSTVVTHYSLYQDGFKRLYDLALSKGARLHVQIAEPVGKWTDRLDLLMTAEDSKHLKKICEEAPLLPNGQRLLHRDIYCDDGDHCPAGTEFMSLTADGELFPCNFVQFSLGNIRDRTIKEMMAAIQRTPWFNCSHPCCPPGEDPEFIRQHIVANKDKPKPINAYQAFGLPDPTRKK